MRRAPNPPFRILHSLPSMQQGSSYIRSLYGLYAASSFSGWPVRFLSERDLARRDFKGARIVLVPDARCVSDDTFAALADFAAAGGIVIADGSEALMRSEWGKPIPSRETAAKRFRRFADAGSRTRFAALSAALDEIKSCPPLALHVADGSQPYSVIWRTGRTAAGEDIAFVANLRREPVALSLEGAWRELLNERDVSGVFDLASCEVILLERRGP